VKSLLRALLVASLGTAVACGYGRAPEKFRQKLVILGFDGMDPTLAQKWMDEGKLPNLRKLSSASGGVKRLATTHSPESPTAWASFATGVNPGKHNI
jgi:predicted AlkP superfamily phosphohydrolase/phosphomutase